MSGWLVQNQQWVFSGIGVTAAGALAGLLRFVWLKAQARIRGPAMPASRRQRAEKLILGRWVGEVIETERTSGDKKKFSVTWEFYKKGKHILCNSPATHVVGDLIATEDYELVVRVVDNRFFMIDFYNTSDVSLNFGTEVIELSDGGREFWGRFVAYSPDFKDIIAGTIKARRA